MKLTYRAVLHGDSVEWIDAPPERRGSQQVAVIFLPDTAPEATHARGRVMVEALARLAAKGAFSDITDPVAWQRAERQERGLPGRRHQ